MTSGSKDRSAETHAFSLTYTMGRGKCLGVVTSESRAFTLIELLIVVAIIAILAAIAVPNFLEAQTRAKVARVTADMRTMATGVELYRIDNNKLPIRHDSWKTANPTPKYVPPLDEKIMDPTDPKAAIGLKQITTPVSYLANIPKDVFNTPLIAHRSNYPELSDGIDYWDDVQLQALRRTLNAIVGLKYPKKGFALVSVGPDQYVGLINSASNPTYPPEPVRSLNTIRFFYDATNGTTSKGNIYRFSDSNTQQDLYPLP